MTYSTDPATVVMSQGHTLTFGEEVISLQLHSLNYIGFFFWWTACYKIKMISRYQAIGAQKNSYKGH